MTHFIALTCSALARSIYVAAASASTSVSVRLFDQGLHNTPGSLRIQLQQAIDAVEPGACDAILLAYGICGGSTRHLEARHTRLVIPRAHDCITLYLGSQERYLEEFNADPGTYWFSVDYMERNGSGTGLGVSLPGVIHNVYDQYAMKYGKENADYLMEVMDEWSKHYSRAVFIDTGLGDTVTFDALAQAQAQKRRWLYARKQGNRRLIELLVSGDWNEDEFLVVPPEHTIEQVSDNRLMQAVIQPDNINS